MAKITKRIKAMQGKVAEGKIYPIDEAFKILKDSSKTKFVESVDVAIRLGIDAKKSDQGVRGSVLLPHGTGKTVRVAVFCPAGEKAEAAKAAGADAVGMDDLAEKMQGGDLNFGRVIATPDAMRVVGKLGQLLGPRGLMPNPKDGSVTADVVTAVKNRVGMPGNRKGATVPRPTPTVPISMGRFTPSRSIQRPAATESRAGSKA